MPRLLLIGSVAEPLSNLAISVLLQDFAYFIRGFKTHTRSVIENFHNNYTKIFTSRSRNEITNKKSVLILFFNIFHEQFVVYRYEFIMISSVDRGERNISTSELSRIN